MWRQRTSSSEESKTEAESKTDTDAEGKTVYHPGFDEKEMANEEAVQEEREEEEAIA